MRKEPLTLLATIAFCLTWGAVHIVGQQLTLNNINISFLWTLFISGGLYALIFHFLISIFYDYIYYFFSKERKFIGVWYQVFLITNMDQATKQERIRFGEVAVTLLPDKKLQFVSNNRKVESALPSSWWRSENVRINGNELSIIYKSRGSNRGETQGSMSYNYHDINGSKVLSGEFNDASPATHYGIIELYRTEKEMLERVDSLVKEDT